MKTTTRAAYVAATALALASLAPGAATAHAPVHPDGVGGHIHHLILGNGECRQIDAVSWDRDTRGLHQGVESSASTLNHGPCPVS